MDEIIKGSNDRPGYQFDGWYLDEKGTRRLNPGGILPGVITIFEKWSPVWYPIVYELNEGENHPLNPKLVNVESGPLDLHPASKPGKRFEGWSYNGRKITRLPAGIDHPIYLKAHFRDPWKIQFETGAGSRLQDLSVLDNNLLPELPVPRRLGYVFEGWYLDEACTQPVPVPGKANRDVMLYAKWSPQIHSITYDLNGGLNSRRNPKTYSYFDGDILLQPASRSGYVFKGWQDERGNPVSIIPARSIGAKHLHAVFEKEDH